MQTTAYRTISGSTYAARVELKAAGCRYDAGTKTWYIPMDLPRGQQRRIEQAVYDVRRRVPGLVIS